MKQGAIEKKKKDKGIKLKLMPREGEGCYLAPVSEEDMTSAKYLELKRIIGGEVFRDNLPLPAHPDVQIEEIGEDEEVVDIDIDPDNINDEEVEVIKALYDEKEYEEIDDDFIQKANLDEVLNEYDFESDKPDKIVKVSKAELEEALQEFIVEHKPLFNEENFKILDFEGIPFEQDHVLKAALEQDSDSMKDPRESSESELEDDVVSNASHFTNTDNRPEVVSVRLSAKVIKTKSEKKPKVEDEEVKKESGHRCREETKEEKKERKEKIKAEKKAIREEKKKKKNELKLEKVKEEKRLAGNYDIRQGTSIIKLGS